MKSQYVKPQRAPAYTRARCTGKAFLSAIESFAEQGYTDASIAYSLGDKFDGLRLNPEYFSRIKNEKGKNGKPTKRANLINEALARGRARGICKQFDMEK